MEKFMEERVRKLERGEGKRRGKKYRSPWPVN